MNVGILNAVIFFLIAFSDTLILSFFDNIPERVKNPGLFFNILSFGYSFIILSSALYIFLAFKEFYFLKQKRDVNTYFNTMIVFFILTSFSSLLVNSPELSFINTSLFIISILLIIINSIRISWIAFIVKKEKLSLLVLSVVISVLFILNLINSGEENIHSQVLNGFSTSLNQFFNLMMIYGAIYFGVLFFTTLFHIPTAEAFDRKAQEVSSLQYFSTLITQVLDFNELSETVTDIAIKVTNADASWIVWNEDGKLKTLANKNIGYLDADIITGILINEKNPAKTTETVTIKLKSTESGKLNEPYSSAAAAPIRTHNEIKGYLIAAKKGDFIFDDEDKSALNTFSDYASVAIENSRLLEESIEKERLEKELDVAREIQRKILPAKNPEFDELSITSVFIPAFEVGGDYYDFFNIDKNKLGFVIADVSGKGISAAFIMAEIKGIFESLAQTIESPKEILIKVNRILQRTLDRKNFVSAAYGMIDLSKEILYISRAGHCPIILIRNGRAENLRPSGIGLGLSFGPHFANTLDEIKIDLQENDLIVLYTDGITEAKNKEMDEFGSRKFEEILLTNSSAEVDEIANKVIRDVTLFSQNNPQHDDITLVVLKWKQKIKNVNGDKEWQNSAPQLKIRET